MSIHKISKWVLYLLMLASIVSTVVYYSIGFQDTAPGPEYTDQLLILAYVFVGLGLGFTLLLSVFNFFKKLTSEPKQALKSLIGPVFIILVFVIGYALSDGTPLTITGYDGPDNIPSMLKFADTMLYSMYALIVAAILMVVASSIYKLFN